MKSARKTKVLGISSGGGHWVQLLRLRPAFAACDLTLVTVRPGYRSDIGNAGIKFRVIPDANRNNKLGLIRTALSVFWVLLRERPDVVISTGAAPGYFAIRFGKLLRAKTIWLDSVANVEELSLSGQQAGKYADLWLTQWPHLSGNLGPTFGGSVL
jgi:UDP-N-acetylglucosamine:LPS N-acetylglucosamine transferase